MEVRSANDVFGNCGAQTQCRRLRQRIGSKALRRLEKEPWPLTSTLRKGFYNRMGKLYAPIPAAKIIGPMTFSNSLVLGLEAKATPFTKTTR
jgi:hypothetical protein